MKIKAKKSLGQNFLIDKNVIKKIVNVGNIMPKSSILEIGAGTGNLTEYILNKNPKKIFIIEKDERLVEKLKIRFNNKVIYLTDESYNSNPLSLKFAIENFNKENQSNKYLILGDMLELGKFSKKLHKKMSKIINKTSIKKVYVIGKDIKETFYAIDRKKRGRILRDKNEIYHLIKNDLNNNDHLMIKASNSTGLNSVALNIKKGKIYAV